jgi:hypothetical protein
MSGGILKIISPDTQTSWIHLFNAILNNEKFLIHKKCKNKVGIKLNWALCDVEKILYFVEFMEFSLCKVDFSGFYKFHYKSSIWY